MNLQAAVQFVEKDGDEVERARLRYLLSRERPTPEIAASLLAGQREDGGWAPSWAPGYSSLDATCFRLAQAEALALRQGEPAVRRAVGFLIQRQGRDGAWEEDAAVAKAAPTWARSGDPAVRLYLTANCGFWLAMLSSPERTPDWSDPAFESAMRAGKTLLTALEDEGREASFLHTLWLAASLWYALGFHTAASAVLARLAGQVERLDPGGLAWMSTSLRKAGVPPEEAPYEEAAGRLEALQAEDGRWSSADGPDFDVHTTLEALRALKQAGRW
jgi:hypothetical protein